MTHKNILVLILRLVAIFLVIRVLENFPSQYASLLSIGETYSQSFLLYSVILPNLILLVFAAIFWMFPNKVITTVVPDAAINKTDPEYFANLNSALISAVGVYIVSFGIADLVYFYSLKHEMSNQFGTGAYLQPNDEAALVATIAEVVIGFLLIVGNVGITKFIARLRHR